MLIEIFADNLTKEDVKHNKEQYSARAIILNNDKLLLEYNKHKDLFVLPGGKMKVDETPENCVIRKIRVETGYLIKAVKKTITLKEYFPEKTYVNHYFFSELVEQEQRLDNPELTNSENGLVWMDITKALMVLDNHDSRNSKSMNIMAREFIALMNSI